MVHGLVWSADSGNTAQPQVFGPPVAPNLVPPGEQGEGTAARIPCNMQMPRLHVNELVPPCSAAQIPTYLLHPTSYLELAARMYWDGKAGARVSWAFSQIPVRLLVSVCCLSQEENFRAGMVLQITLVTNKWLLIKALQEETL